MPINSFLDYLTLEKKYSKHTTIAYRNDIISFQKFCNEEFEILKLENVEYNQIRSWIVSLVNLGCSNRTINRKISALKTFYLFLQKTKQIKLNPLAKHKSLKTAKEIQIPFSKKEIDLVLNKETDKTDFESVRDLLIVEMFYSTGIRRSELINLKISDIDVGNQSVKVVGKRNKERSIPLISCVKKSIENYLPLRNKLNSDTPYIFITKKGKKTYDSLVYRIINHYFSGVSSKTKKSPHIIRHSFATHLLNEGANLNSIKELLGHSSLASTQIYAHSSLEKIKKMYNQAHPRAIKTN